jgi:transketolase
VDIIASFYSSLARDSELVLSKGHCILAWLAVLKNIDRITDEQYNSYYENKGLFGGHPKRFSIPSVTWSTGSLGHGLAVVCGKAFASRSKTFVCILGDGETNEGSVWESLMFLNQHRLSNVLVVIDNNKKESLALTNNILGIECFIKSLSSTNLDVEGVDGHDHDSLMRIFDRFVKGSDSEFSKPMVILADTIKGKSVSFMEQDPKWHHRKLTSEEFDHALADIGLHS